MEAWAVGLGCVATDLEIVRKKEKEIRLGIGVLVGSFLGVLWGEREMVSEGCSLSKQNH